MSLKYLTPEKVEIVVALLDFKYPGGIEPSDYRHLASDLARIATILDTLTPQASRPAPASPTPAPAEREAPSSVVPPSDRSAAVEKVIRGEGKLEGISEAVDAMRRSSAESVTIMGEAPDLDLRDPAVIEKMREINATLSTPPVSKAAPRTRPAARVARPTAPARPGPGRKAPNGETRGKIRALVSKSPHTVAQLATRLHLDPNTVAYHLRGLGARGTAAPGTRTKAWVLS